MQSMAIPQLVCEITEERLAEAARDGDADAFALLVARYRDTAFAYAYARLRHRDEAEDVVQEAFVRAFIGLPRMQAARCWAAWLMQIVRNLCHDSLRRKRGRFQEILDDAWPDAGPTPETLLLHTERGHEIRRAVADLPENLRVPFLMHYVSRRSYREIALALDIPETTVVGRLATALQRLRRRCKSI